MTRHFLPLLLLIACTDPHYLDPVQPDPVPACQLNGTARYMAFNFTGANTVFRMGYGDTITDPVEVVTNSSYTWEVPAGRTYLYIWNKFIPGYGVYVMGVDTCQVFECAVRVYNKEIYLNDKKLETMKCDKCNATNIGILTPKKQPDGSRQWWCEYCMQGIKAPPIPPSEFDNYKTYKERVNFQEIEWVSGRSLHNVVDEECCPDFSCCHPEMLWDEDKRKIFYNASDEQKESLLFTSLSNLIPKATIINGEDEINSQLN